MSRFFVACGLMVVGAVAYGVDQANLRLNYTQVHGKIVSANVDCYVEGHRSKLVKKGEREMAYMPCSIAPEVAAEFGYAKSDVHRRVEFSYDFVSPVDGNHHKGKTTRSDVAEGQYAAGKDILVFAHSSQADYSRIN